MSSQEEQNGGVSVKEKYLACRKLFKSIENSSAAVADKAKISGCIKDLEELTLEVSSLGLFSSNEHYSELETTHLPFLLLPAYLSVLVQLPQMSNEHRKQSLELAEVYLKDFLSRLKSYELISEQKSVGGGGDAQQIREEKIRRFKEQKELENKLAHLTAESEDDGDSKREFYLTELRLWSLRARQELSDIEKEKPMLERMEQLRLSDKGDSKAEKSDRRPFKPVILTRTKLQKEVFGLGYPSVPTMTVDEWYTQMVQEGNFPSGNSVHKVEQQPTEEQEAFSKEQATERDDPDALRAARAWDEYRDDHRRGWGHMHNKG